MKLCCEDNYLKNKSAIISDSYNPGVYLSLVIPTYNEKKNIAELLKRLCAVLDQCLAGRYELIIVDDDSPDRTWEEAAKLSQSYQGLKVLKRQGERSLSNAIIDGWKIAEGEILGVMDADLQHPPEDIEKLLNALKETPGADLAVASRHVDGGGVSDWSFARRILSRLAQGIACLIIPETARLLKDPLSGYFLIKRKAISHCELNPLGYKILLEVLSRGRIKKVKEVGYIFNERIQGGSKVTPLIYWQYILHLIRLRFSKKCGG